MLHLLQVNITEDELLIAAVDDCGSVTAGKDIADRSCPELSEDCRLSTKSHLLLVCECPGGGDNEVEETPISQGTQKIVCPFKFCHQDTPGYDLPAQVLPGDLLQAG